MPTDEFVAAVKIECALVIPARRRSTRLPDKLLLRDTGKPLIQHTFEAASRARLPDAVIVATDDREIAREARRFGAQVAMTSGDCRSGTDRVAEVARRLPRAEIVVNVQGDEPDIEPESIDRLVAMLRENRSASMATLAAPIRTAT
ncbi:MAG: NTP transferase domain-containing protein, partial [Planctomycetota bacterium]